MQSLPRASSLRRSFAAPACALLLFASGSVRAEPALTPDEPSTVPARPLAEGELDPTRAFADRLILLVRTPGDEGVMTRLRADLRESDWRILEVRPDDRFESAPLGTIAERERASAAMRVDSRRWVIELWVLRPDGPIQETITAPGEQRSEQVLALRVSETLRARGLLVSRSERDGVEERPLSVPYAGKPASVIDDASPRRPHHEPTDSPRLWLGLGPGVLLSPGGLDPMPLAEIGIGLEIARRWSLGMGALVPFSSQSVAAPEGQASVSNWLVSGLVELEWARWSFGGFRSGIGAGAAVTTMSGTAAPGFAGVDDTVTTFAPLARSSFHVSLSRAFRLRSTIAVGATFPPVRIVFASREVASWGRPFVVTSIALETNPGVL